MNTNVNELFEEINDQELEGQVVGGMISRDNPVPCETGGIAPRKCYQKY